MFAGSKDLIRGNFNKGKNLSSQTNFVLFNSNDSKKKENFIEKSMPRRGYSFPEGEIISIYKFILKMQTIVTDCRRYSSLVQL